MANCLVTKLKEVVNDVDIPVLGDIVIKNHNGGLTRFTTGIEPSEVKVVSGRVYSDSERTVEIPQTSTVAGGYTTAYFYTKAGEDSAISISNKYGIYSIIAGSCTDYNLDDIWYSNITVMRMESNDPNPYFNGDLEPLVEHLAANYVRVGRIIERTYPVDFTFPNTGLRLHGSTDWQTLYTVYMLRDNNLFTLYRSEWDGTTLKPMSEQFVHPIATYNVATKLWNYIDV